FVIRSRAPQLSSLFPSTPLFRSLVSRMVSLIASGRAHPSQMAAITFTRKAAAELRERFQIRLEAAAAAETDPVRRARLQAGVARSEEHTSELQSRENLVCRLLLD